jgi:hypothetical protein
MKFDRFIYFSIFSAQQQEMIKSYFSPEHESSIFKQVPIDQMEQFKRIARMLNPGRPIRVRFRGKRSGAQRDYTKKCHAHSVSVYVD